MAKAVSDSPKWFDPALPEAQRQAVVDIDFEQKIANREEYKKAALDMQQKLRLAHQQLVEEAALKSEHNPLNQKAITDQQAVDSQGFIANTAGTLKRSLLDTASRVTMVDDLVGKPDGNYPSQLAQYLNKTAAAPMTREAKQLAHDMKVWGERREKSGLLGDVVATARFAGDVLSNPGGIIDTAAQSVGSMASMAAGAKAGGAVAAGLTAATGGWAAPAAPFITGAGMLAAEAADAGSAKMAEKIREGLDERGIAYTPANIQMFMDKNPELIKRYQKESLTYGGALGLADVAVGGFFSKLATLPTRAARQAAMRSIDDVGRAALAARATELGIPVKTLTEDFINAGTRSRLAEQTLKSKLGYKTLSYAGEVASEPISEAIGTAAAGDKIKAEDLAYETIGGIGAGPIGASINTAAFGTKLAADTTKEFVKDVATRTPETKAALKTLEEETAKVNLHRDAPAKGNYQQEIAEVEANDPRIDEWMDPAKETYNPVKAITALAKFTGDTEATNKAEALYQAVKKDMLETEAQADALEAKGDQATTAERKEHKALTELAGAKIELVLQMSQQLAALREKNAKAEAEKDVAPVDPKTATPQEIVDHEVETYGSSPNALKMSQLEASLKRTDLPAEDRGILESIKEAAVAQQALEDSQKKRTSAPDKTMSLVANDIYRGDREYRGISSYKQAIANYLNPAVNNLAGALAQVKEMAKFRDAHEGKLKALTDAYNEIRKQPFGAQTKVKVNGASYNIHHNSGSLLAHIGLEVTALQKEVAAAEKLVGRKSNTAQANTRVVPSSPSTGQPAAPVVTPATPTTPASPPPVKKPDPPSQQLVARTKQYARAAAKALANDTVMQATVQWKEETLRKKHGEAVAKIFREELAQALSEKQTEKTQSEALNQDAKELGLSESRFAAIKDNKQKQAALDNARKLVDAGFKPNLLWGKKPSQIDALVAKAALLTKQKENQSDEIKESTDSVNPDIVSANESPEIIDPGYMMISYTNVKGEQVTKAYNEAVIELTQEIDETNSILKCIMGR